MKKLQEKEKYMCEEIKRKFLNKTIWLYTGSLWEEIYDKRIIRYLDILVDGEFIIEEKDNKLLWKGSKNQRVIDVQRTIKTSDMSNPIIHCPDYY